MHCSSAKDATDCMRGQYSAARPLLQPQMSCEMLRHQSTFQLPALTQAQQASGHGIHREVLGLGVQQQHHQSSTDITKVMRRK